MSRRSPTLYNPYSSYSRKHYTRRRSPKKKVSFSMTPSDTSLMNEIKNAERLYKSFKYKYDMLWEEFDIRHMILDGMDEGKEKKKLQKEIDTNENDLIKLGEYLDVIKDNIQSLKLEAEYVFVETSKNIPSEQKPKTKSSFIMNLFSSPVRRSILHLNKNIRQLENQLYEANSLIDKIERKLI